MLGRIPRHGPVVAKMDRDARAGSLSHGPVVGSEAFDVGSGVVAVPTRRCVKRDIPGDRPHSKRSDGSGVIGAVVEGAGQLDAELTAMAGLTGQADLASEGLRQVLDDGQAQAGASDFA